MLGRYARFIFLNSSVRGPFLPAYLRGALHWAEAFTGYGRYAAASIYERPPAAAPGAARGCPCHDAHRANAPPPSPRAP